MSENQRQVSFLTILNLLKWNPIPFFLGLGFTIIPILVSMLILSIGNDSPKVDYDLICEKGTETIAQITDIETEHNIEINGVHPSMISYKYLENGSEKNFKFRTLSERKVQNLNIGSEVQIKYLSGKSIIKDLKPFNADFLKFIPFIFLIIGLPLLLYSTYQIRKQLNLYKNGQIAKGKILSMMPKSGLPISKIGQGIIIHYQYETTKGKSIVEESFTTDFSILNDKKKDDYIPIFISRKNEQKSCIVPKLESLRNNWNIEFD